VVGRLFSQPFLDTHLAPLKHLGFGAAGSIGTHTAGALTITRRPASKPFFPTTT